MLGIPKELAEHNMLVDLGRNDLGRISRFGTVEVEQYHEGSEVLTCNAYQAQRSKERSMRDKV